MNSTAKKCILWAIGLIVIGAALATFGPDVVAAVYPEIWNSPGGVAFFGAVSLTVAILQSASMPVAGALVGAAVVISTLRPQACQDQAEHGPAPDSQQT